MIRADFHLHSSFSGDSIEEMENHILTALTRGFNTLCITEHMDLDYPVSADTPKDLFKLDTDSYYHKYCELRDKYRPTDTLYNTSSSHINLLFGVELGLQPHLASIHSEYISKYPFDFIIGSEHVTNGKDPYYPYFYEGRSEKEAYTEYFEDILTNLKAFDDIDTFGHLDYVVRYGPNKNKNYTYSEYADYIDPILEHLISKNIGLEVNSGGFKHQLNSPNPCIDIISRYKELGGSIITIGSDAHTADRIGADFDKIEKILYKCGFDYYCTFINRKPHFIKFD